MTDCPVCGHEYDPPDLAVDLNRNLIIVKGRATRVPPKVAEVFSVLLDAGVDGMDKEDIIQKVYGYDGGPESRVLDVYLAWIRKVLKGSGWTVPRAYRNRPARLARDGCVHLDMRKYRVA